MMQAQAWNVLTWLGLFSCSVFVHNETSSCSRGYRTTTSGADVNPTQELNPHLLLSPSLASKFFTTCTTCDGVILPSFNPLR